MVRRYKPKEQRGPRLLYWILVIVVATLWIWGFKFYFERYDYTHPEITWAVTGIDNELVVINGVLLWNETLLSAPFEGAVTFPLGAGPVRVARGSVVAVVKSGSRSAQIKAPQQGYFVAGVDGKENSWKYSELWPGVDLLPQAPRLGLLQNNDHVLSGQAVGKLAEQPQELRFIGYADVAGDMEKQIKNNRLRVKMDEEDTISSAGIRVYNDMPGGKIKLYLTLPWFQPSLLLSRNYRLIIEAGSIDGAMVPESALLRKNGVIGVYRVTGTRVVFQPVEGKHVDGGNFLITGGLSVGTAIVEDASTAREGRIQLW